MHYAIIAAGDGSRLVSEGVLQPKPLVRINGIPMIERLMRIFAKNNAESISVIVNEGMSEVQEFLHGWSSAENLKDLGIGKFNLVVESTPSSMHSFYSLSKVIEAEYVCLTTVDTIFKEEQFAEFINQFKSQKDIDGYFAVTPFVDDEKPLYVETCESQIIGFHDNGNFSYVSGGIYCLNTTKAFPVLRHCIETGVHRMRNFQRALIEAGMDIKAFVFPKIMDVDHAEDILKAHSFLRVPRKLLFIFRAEEFSPNNIAKDRKILDLTIKKIKDGRPDLEIVPTKEEDFCKDTDLNDISLVVGMPRRVKSLMKLQNSRIKSYNSARGIINTATSRELTLTLLNEAGISVPDFWSYDPEADEMFLCEPTLQNLLPGWVKAMRYNGSKIGDVTYVETPIDADSTVLRLASESVQDIVVTKHLHGDLLKVYAVVDEKNEIKFSKWFYPQETGYTKFGEESGNDALCYYHVEESMIKDLIRRIAQILELQFFGIDLIVGPTGEMTVIDVNDWPSYSVCQDEAAEAIARTILIDIEAC